VSILLQPASHWHRHRVGCLCARCQDADRSRVCGPTHLPPLSASELMVHWCCRSQCKLVVHLEITPGPSNQLPHNQRRANQFRAPQMPGHGEPERPGEGEFDIQDSDEEQENLDGDEDSDNLRKRQRQRTSRFPQSERKSRKGPGHVCPSEIGRGIHPGPQGGLQVCSTPN
jgi:hypothetical protein